MSQSRLSLLSGLSGVPSAGQSPVVPASAGPTAVDADVPSFLSRNECQAILTQLRALGISRRIDLTSQWRGDVRWGRNRITTASDWRDNFLTAQDSDFFTNQVDARSLRAVVDQFHAHQAYEEPYAPQVVWAPVAPAFPATHIWSDATYAQTPAERSTIAAQLAAVAEQAGLLAAGYLSIEARGTAYAPQSGLLYAPQTIAQCSLTVRDPQGTGSGWAGASSYDWGRIDASTLAAIAVEKCLKSRNPVKLEPGRYTTILEPQAAYELFRIVFDPTPRPDDPGREFNEAAGEYVQRPFNRPEKLDYKVGQYGKTISYRKTRLGEQVFDPRLSVRSDPLDLALGTLPFTYDGDPYVPVTWVEHGVLTTLAYDSEYAHQTVLEPAGKPWSGAWRVDSSEPPVSIDDMIATTKRGLWVTRFWDVNLLYKSLELCTGLTRDGLWLIENGKVSHPVTNFRFTESPMFVFNNVEQIGTPVPVFNPECPAVMPAVKVRDFSFTSLVDAI